ncbi:MAG: DUF6249 domain-containing protein [bacterium]
METEILAVSIPIFGIAAGVIIAVVSMTHRLKQNQLEHQERMLAIEKGATLPQPIAPPAKRSNPYLWGFILMAVGLAMVIAMSLEGDNAWGWGFMFLFIGIAILLANWLYARNRMRLNGTNSSSAGEVESL